MRSKGASPAPSEVSVRRMVRQRSACSLTRRMSSLTGLSGGSERASSFATTVMVASGVPSSCAAAAASPSSAERCCSRASTSSVAASASESSRVSSATRQACTPMKAMAMASADQMAAR